MYVVYASKLIDQRQVGGPSWSVKLGRRDSTTTSISQASNDLPSPFLGLDELILAFDKKGLNARDLVALSGNNQHINLHTYIYKK